MSFKRRIGEKCLYALRAVVELIAPRFCLSCGETLLLREEHLCTKCFADFPFTHFWDSKYNPMSDRFNHHLGLYLGDCVAVSANSDHKRSQFVFASALFFYNSVATYRKIPHSLKYESNLAAGRFFSKLLASRLKSSPLYEDVNLIVPVPLHWRRKWERGYNQAEIIASEIAKDFSACMCKELLFRRKHTKTQTKLHGSDKFKNVNKAFSVNRQYCIKGRDGREDVLDLAKIKKHSSPFKLSFKKPCLRPLEEGNIHILLVDDVFTTGATLGACYEALRTGFPTMNIRISIASLAFVQEL